MNKHYIGKIPFWALFFLIVNISSLCAERTLFDFGWKFHRGDIEGAKEIKFDDSDWRLLDLPHDFSIEDLPGTNSPFDPDAISGVDTGFTTGGIGWYRKEFTLPANAQNKHFFIFFDGVYMNADFWLNGQLLGNHPYGYTSFWYDIKKYIKRSEKNILAVKVKNEGVNSRWYSGSGIYRHVWLIEKNPLQLAEWGTSVTTPEVSQSSAKVLIKSKVNNESQTQSATQVVSRILDAEGHEVAKAQQGQIIGGKSSYEFIQSFIIKAPELWSLETPVLYTLVNEIYDVNQKTKPVKSDDEKRKFGIRSISFDSTNGFMLNGKSMKLKGGCMHHDNGPLGSAAYGRAEERRVELMKASGFNAIRTAHNPPSTAFLNACDRLGMLVIDEAFDMWREAHKSNDYHLYFDKWWQKDIESLVLRDRNHPSVIMWSIGNEIKNVEKPEVAAVAKMLSDEVRKLDPTRPVTSAVTSITDNDNPKKALAIDPYMATLDVVGYNYERERYHMDHERVPQRVMVGSESYPLEAFDYWMGVIDNPWVIGDFVWTGFDYLGEASIGWLGYWQEQTFYPWSHAYCGDIDICGFKRPQSFYRDVLWNNGKKLSLFVVSPEPSFKTNPKKVDWSIWEWNDVVAHWNWEGLENKPLTINVYSGYEQVELFLNNKSIGKKETSRQNKFIATFEVPYSPGVLKAVGINKSKVVATDELRTAAKSYKIALKADRSNIIANKQDLSYISVEIQDEKGVTNPKADQLVKFEIEGPGTIIAVGSSNPMSLESFQAKQRKAWRGRCLVIVKAQNKSGMITLKATADGLKPASVKILTKIAPAY